MDEDYLYVYSGLKPAGAIFDLEIDITRISDIIANRYLDKWNRMYDALILEYEILENYNMEETERQTDDGNQTRTGTETGTDTTNSNSSDTTTVEDQLYGFDSQSPSPADSSKSKTATSISDNNTFSVDRSTTATLLDKKTIERYLTRHGNIGVTTNAQMQEQYLVLQNKWGNFFETIFKDMDSVLVCFCI